MALRVSHSMRNSHYCRLALWVSHFTRISHFCRLALWVSDLISNSPANAPKLNSMTNLNKIRLSTELSPGLTITTLTHPHNYVNNPLNRNESPYVQMKLLTTLSIAPLSQFTSPHAKFTLTRFFSLTQTYRHRTATIHFIIELERNLIHSSKTIFPVKLSFTKEFIVQFEVKNWLHINVNTLYSVFERLGTIYFDQIQQKVNMIS